METIPPDISALNKPQPGVEVQTNVFFQLPSDVSVDASQKQEFESINWGRIVSEFEFKGTMNGGYVVYAKFTDAGYSMMSKFIEYGYLEVARRSPVIMRFNLAQRRDIDAIGTEDSEMRYQIAYVTNLNGDSSIPGGCNVVMLAVDPPSWNLNKGDAFGGVYKGKISSVIKEVVNKYSPGTKVEVSETIDSDAGKWWMMRQDPKTFIKSLTDWSSALTKSKTNWLVAVDGWDSSHNSKIAIKAQGEFQSRQRAQYNYGDSLASNSVLRWKSIADNALSITNTQIVTHGLSVISGKYIDVIAEKRKAVVKDTTTDNKIIPKTDVYNAFSKPFEDTGRTSIASIPEVYSAGELGVPYKEYVDGRARNMWLSMTNAVMRAKITVMGHGIWRDTFGLGVDTIFLTWKSDAPQDGSEYWYLTGHWLVCGFHHYCNNTIWHTDLDIARFDATSNSGNDAVGKVVPKLS